MGEVLISGGAIRIDGVPTQIISGTIHYFRICRAQWADRIAKAKMMGLNAIETYVCHNLHEPKPGEFDFSGMLDLEAFLSEIQRAGLYAIVRPGPYICAEWENGGLPAWLCAQPGVEFRCLNPVFLAAVDRYLDELLPRLKKHLHTSGGPVIMMQLENEYGSYGNDKQYLEHMRNAFLRNGIDVPLFTSDGPDDWMIQGGTLPGCFQTLNFGSRAKEAFTNGRKYQPEGPDFCMEFWNGWFDHWGEEHHTREARDAAVELDVMLRNGASVNFYVFCGGTNFGFTSGANGNGDKPGDYAPTVTSYDYDAPLSEWGDPTAKFFAFQEVIRRYRPDAAFDTPKPGRKAAYGEVVLTASAPLFRELDRLAKKRESVRPPTMEESGQNFGFIHYRTKLSGPFRNRLYFPEVHDRVTVYVNGTYLGAVGRNDAERFLPIEIGETGATLDLLVENQGRINYGPLVGRDRKGLPLGVGICWQMLSHFDVWNLELDNLDAIRYGAFAETENLPTFHRGEFEVDSPADTFLEFPGVKGVVWVNGFNLGRYWNIGPGNTLYVPSPLLKKGCNEIVVFELHKLKGHSVHFTDRPQLG